MQYLPSETISYISSFTGAAQIFLRQICSQWRDILPVSETYHWLNKVSKENNSLSLLYLAIEQGCRINNNFFQQCVKYGNLPILGYLNTIDVDHWFSIDEIKSLDVAKWLYENKYDINCRNNLLKFTFSLNIAEFLYCNKLCDENSLDKSRLLTGDNRKIKLISNINNPLFIFAFKFANINGLKYVCDREKFSRISFKLFNSKIDFLEKLKYLHEKGLRIDLQGCHNIKNVEVLDWLDKIGYNTNKVSSHSENFEILKWRESMGYKIKIISRESIESVKWCLERIDDKILDDIPYLSNNFEIAKIIVDYLISKNIQIKIRCYSSRIAKYLIEKEYIFDKALFLIDLISIGNMKLIKEFCDDDVSYLENLEHIAMTNNVEILDYFYNLGVPIGNALYHASNESQSPASIKWLYSHGVRVKDEKTLREEYFPNTDYYCRKVFKRLHEI